MATGYGAVQRRADDRKSYWRLALAHSTAGHQRLTAVLVLLLRVAVVYGEEQCQAGSSEGQCQQPTKVLSSRSAWANHDPADLVSRNATELLHELYGDRHGWKMPKPKLFHADMTIFQISEEPQVFFLKQFLSPKTTRLADRAFNDKSIKQYWHDNNQGDIFAPNALTMSDLPGAQKLNKLVNARIAALAGMPESHVEQGYMTLKSPGFEFTQLHHDQGNQRKNDRHPTVQSVVLFLSENPTALTNFPLAKPLSPERSDAAWEGLVESEILPELKRSGFRHIQREDTREVAKKILQRHKDLCSHPQRLIPQPGDAVWFFNFVNKSEDLRSIHGTCSVPAGKKLSLSKFILAGPESTNGQR